MSAAEDARERARDAVARGDRPTFHVRTSGDEGWVVDACPWLTGGATDPQEALTEARRELAAWLGVDGADIDVEVAERPLRSMTPPTDEGQLYGG